jgi:hypothetical protein
MKNRTLLLIALLCCLSMFTSAGRNSGHCKAAKEQKADVPDFLSPTHFLIFSI